MNKQELNKFIDKISPTGPGGVEKIKRVLKEVLDKGGEEGITEEELLEALSGKQDTLVSGTNLKTVNNTSLLGSGNIAIPKGDKGDKGDTGPQGPQGPQGLKGDTGVSADYPITIYNGLDSDATDQALSAAQGNVLDGKIGQLGQKVDTFGEGGTVSETQSVASGSRFDKTLSLSTYTGQFIRFKVTRTGGTSTEYTVYNGSYSLGSLFQYGTIYEFKLNSQMGSLRFMGMALEGSAADYTIDIVIIPDYKIEDADRTRFVTKSTDYTSSIISGKYINTNNSTLPTNPTTLANCGCISGEISGGDILKVKGSGTSKNVALYAFYDKNKSRIMSSSAASTNGQDALEIIAPDESAYFACNFYTYDSVNDLVLVKSIFIIEEEIEKVKDSNQTLATQMVAVEKLLWKEKTVVCFGDSITEFADSHLKTYPDYIAELTGANVINVGIGGTRLACRTTPVLTPTTAAQGYAALDCANLIDAVANNDFDIVDAGCLYVKENEGDDNTTIIARLKAINWANVDVVTFFIGTNDWGGSQNYGTSGTIAKNTVLGAINFILSNLLTTYPHLKIYWFTPIVRWLASSLAQRTDENWGGTATRGDKTLEQFVEDIYAEVKKSSMPVCDMYHTLGWYKYNFSQYFYDTDGTHPTKGFPEIARKIVAFVNANRTF